MPYINVRINKADVTAEQKRLTVEQMTQTWVRTPIVIQLRLIIRRRASHSRTRRGPAILSALRASAHDVSHYHM